MDQYTGTNAQGPRKWQYQVNYCVDLVFCIDATQSMYPLMDMVKENALRFYEDFRKSMDRKNKRVAQLRIRVIAFRDYWYDKEDAMLVTRFFRLPEEREDFAQCIHSIQVQGGGDDPEDGLEALTYAIHSDWTKEGFKRRHVIVVWSDAPAHPLGFGRKAANYPQSMPKTFAELTALWGNHGAPGKMDQNAKRLLLFTPDGSGWSEIAREWNQVYLRPSQAGNGLGEQDYATIMDTICNSI